MVAQQISSLATSMNAKIVGSGPETVVLAHGFGGDQTIWDEVVPFLVQRKYQVIVFDWAFSGEIEDPGFYDPVRHGSYEGFGSDLVGLLDEVKVKSTVFVGHSMAGMIGCLASIKRPELFQKLILVGASPRYLNSDDFKGGFEVAAVEQLISSIESSYLEWAPAFANIAVGLAHQASVERFLRSLQKMRPEVALSLAKTVFYIDHRDILDQVSVPNCHIIQASNDVVVPNSVALYMYKRINAGKKSVCTLDMMELDGHFPQLTGHEQFIGLLTGLLDASSPVIPNADVDCS